MHLAEYMQKRRLSDEEVARLIGRSRVTVSRIRRWIVRPDWDTIIELRRLSRGKVSANDFTDMPKGNGE